MALFVILFFIAVVGIIFLHYKTKKEKPEKLLHRIQKSCNIDSVQFEKRFMFIVFFLRKQLVFTKEKTKTILRKVNFKKEKILNKTKQSIRKKLFSKEEEKSVSEFISEMKK